VAELADPRLSVARKWAQLESRRGRFDQPLAAASIG